MQEKELAGAEWEGFEDFGHVAVSEPKAYSKIRLPYIHSWAPIYFDYDKVEGISSESREKLKLVRPDSIGQASRINGVRTSDITVLLVYLRR